MFGTSKNALPLEIPYNWNADYRDGSSVTEYDEQGKKRDFYEIDRSKVLRFGLFGANEKHYFEMTDGSFNINGKRIDMEYILPDGNVIGLSSNFEEKDIITYKEAYTDLNLKVQGVQKSNLKSINFGYKTRICKNIDGTEIILFFQPVMSLGNGEPCIELKITSSEDLDGYLVFKQRGREVGAFNIPLKKDRAGQWMIRNFNGGN